MQQQAQGQIFLHHREGEVLGHAQRSRPVDAIEEVSLTIQLIGTSQHVHKVAQRVHDGKGQQEDRRTHGAVAVVVQLEVACEEDGAEEHQGHVEEKVQASPEDAGNATVAIGWRWRIVHRTARRGSRRSCTRDLAHVLQVLHVLLNSSWLVDHDPLLGGILAQVGHNGLFSSRVDGNPLGDVKGISVHDDPGVFLLVVLGHIFRRQASSATRGSSWGTTTAATDFALHGEVLGVLLHRSWLVDHIPLFCGILSKVCHDRLLASWMDGNPFGHVNGLTVHHNPGIFLLVVLGDLFHGHSRRPGIGHRRRRGARLQVLAVRQQFFPCHIFRLLAGLLLLLLLCTGHGRQLHELLLGAQGRGRRDAGHAPRVDRVEQRYPGGGPGAWAWAGGDLSCCVQALNGGSRTCQHLSVIHGQSTRAGIDGGGHHGSQHRTGAQGGEVAGGDLHLPGQHSGAAEFLHHVARDVEVAEPFHGVGVLLGDHDAEGPLALGHGFGTSLGGFQLVDELVAVPVDELSSRAHNRIGQHDLELVTFHTRNHGGGGVHGHVAHVLGRCLDIAAEADAIPIGSLITGGGHLQELRCRLRHQRGRRSVAGEAAGGDQHEAQLLGSTASLIFHAHDLVSFSNQLGDGGGSHNLQLVRLGLGDLLQLVHHCIGDHCSWKVIFGSKRPCDFAMAWSESENHLILAASQVQEPVHVLGALLDHLLTDGLCGDQVGT
mmetsp:Transcript_77307/g.170757  ORF Transcript_77307/g.170757 Transcript_77307/m.170757 type:complete len:714 (-) Transcript_77307:248-2389(-)